MSFFPPDPPEVESEGPEREPTPWWKPSDTEFAPLFPIDATIAVTENVAIILAAVRVYSNGVEFLIDRRIRRGRASSQEWREMQSKINDHFVRFHPKRLRYGVLLGDGQQVILGSPPGVYGVTPQSHTLSHTGGGGGGSEDFYRADDALWLWPLPPEGPVEVVVQWPAFDVPESRVVLDSVPLRELASQARPVWGED
ncbi:MULTISPECIES: hypothetical protein [unclassified Leifsonia]|uniref:hypothetical protein n=1 Tax=unclassified Leifsonia TaxID=2663824 RepID=UPI0008A7D3C3|nr:MULTISPECIES: hypothetical protein [unclassified Leifsonia]SEI16587.1 hypothetical protein SAMN04515694_12533 [Leifsonia sp. CL154]SFM07517.1 hypothetical protein SAMN04515692_12533 [Leifsonia sp. CL147]